MLRSLSVRMAAKTTKSDHLRSFGRKRTKRLQGVRQARLDTLLPHLRIPLAGTPPINPHALFTPKPSHIWLEIGFGGGEHLAAQAATHPDVGFLGCEPFLDGVSKLIAMLQEQALTNVRLLDDDVRLLLERLPDACLDKVFILFPDPWPKARHHKRRLINTALLCMLARVMKSGGALCMVTDDAEYAQWILLHSLAAPDFRWTARAPEDFTQPPEGWVQTRYQQKAAAEGRSPCFLIFERL